MKSLSFIIFIGSDFSFSNVMQLKSISCCLEFFRIIKSTLKISFTHFISKFLIRSSFFSQLFFATSIDTAIGHGLLNVFSCLYNTFSPPIFIPFISTVFWGTFEL